jgi:hypothetical protein
MIVGKRQSLIYKNAQLHGVVGATVVFLLEDARAVLADGH